jgi:hypothetical protein
VKVPLVELDVWVIGIPLSISERAFWAASRITIVL